MCILARPGKTLRLREVIDDPESKGMPSAFLGKEKKISHRCQGPSFQIWLVDSLVLIGLLNINK